MKCPNCESENSEGKRFCGQCGAALEPPSIPSAPPYVPEPRSVAAAPPPIPLMSERGKRRLKIGAIVVAIALVIGSVLGYLYYYQPVRGSGSVSSTTIDAGQAVTFGFTPSKGVSPYRYLWTFGDGTASGEQNPRHTYKAPGTYGPAVTVTDTAGETTTWMTTVLVNPLPSVVGTVSPSAGDHSFIASLTAQGQDGTPGYSYLWQFGDGASSNLQNTTHFYSAGNYIAVVVVEDAVGMTARWSANIRVPGVSVTGSVTPDVGALSLNASFSAQGLGGTPGYSYLWQFGDGTTADVQNPIHNYATGTYTAIVIVTDMAGRTASWSTTVIVNLNLTVGMTYYYTGPGWTETFGCTPSQGVSPYSFYWDFGDGMSTTLQNPVHEYARTGLYTVNLQVTDSTGETVEIQRSLNFT